MIRVENDCVSCALPCIHCSKGRDRIVHYCDECGYTAETLYEYDSEELCEECLLGRFEIVDQEE